MYTPSFILKGVKYINVVKKYSDSTFLIDKNEIDTTTFEGFELSKNNTENIQLNVFNSDKLNDRIIKIKDKNGIERGFVYSNIEIKRKCQNYLCNLEFDHKPIGYPVSYEEKRILKNEKLSKYHVFHVKGVFCSFGCALFYIKNINYFSNPSFTENSELYLKMLFFLLYPEENDLRINQDYYLLKENGGSLTKEEWLKNNYIYTETGKIILCQILTEFERTTC